MPVRFSKPRVTNHHGLPRPLQGRATTVAPKSHAGPGREPEAQGLRVARPLTMTQRSVAPGAEFSAPAAQPLWHTGPLVSVARRGSLGLGQAGSGRRSGHPPRAFKWPGQHHDHASLPEGAGSVTGPEGRHGTPGAVVGGFGCCGCPRRRATGMLARGDPHRDPTQVPQGKQGTLRLRGGSDFSNVWKALMKSPHRIQRPITVPRTRH